jgi:hypothetical protein
MSATFNPAAAHPNHMSEAEVALRLAFYLVRLPGARGPVRVSLDGAHSEVHGNTVFAILDFLHTEQWQRIPDDDENTGRHNAKNGENKWQGLYRHAVDGSELYIDAKSGWGDVVCEVGGFRVRVECKKGPLEARRGNPEYPLLREALGQLLTTKEVRPNDLLAAAVPDSAKFRSLALAWREAPLVKKAGVAILLVGRDGQVDGLGGVVGSQH